MNDTFAPATTTTAPCNSPRTRPVASVLIKSLLRGREDYVRQAEAYERRAAEAATPSLAQANLRGAEAMRRIVRTFDEKLECVRLGIRWRLSKRRGGFAW